MSECRALRSQKFDRESESIRDRYYWAVWVPAYSREFQGLTNWEGRSEGKGELKYIYESSYFVNYS